MRFVSVLLAGQSYKARVPVLRRAVLRTLWKSAPSRGNGTLANRVCEERVSQRANPLPLPRALEPYFLFALFGFAAAAFSALASECFLLWRATALATSSSDSLPCFSECNTSLSGPGFVAIALLAPLLSTIDILAPLRTILKQRGKSPRLTLCRGVGKSLLAGSEETSANCNV